MILRDNVIRQVLRTLGEVSVYNDNRNETYRFVADVLDDVISSVAYRTDLKFNSSTVELTRIGTNELGENRFNLPIDFLNKIRFVDCIARIEGEFVYSNEDKVFVQYCRDIDLSEYPGYMETSIMLLTALRTAESMNQFNDRVNLLNTRLEEELKRIYNIEWRAVTRKI